MTSEGKARLFRRKDNKYLIYIPKTVAEDSMFPFKGESVKLKMTFHNNPKRLVFVEIEDHE